MQTLTVLEAPINTANAVEAICEKLRGHQPTGGLETITLEAEHEGFELVIEVEVDADCGQKISGGWDDEPYFIGSSIHIEVLEVFFTDSEGEDVELSDEQLEYISQKARDYLI